MSALLLHRDVQPDFECGGQVADQRNQAHKLFGTDYWCVYCGKKWNADGTEAKRINLDNPGLTTRR